MKPNFNHRKLRGKIKEKFGSESKLAKTIGLSPTSLSYRLNNGVEFSSTEIYRIIAVLDLESSEIKEYFFEENVCKKKQTDDRKHKSYQKTS